MDAAGRFIEHITSRQYLFRFTFQLKAVFPFKDVAKNETRMSMFGRSRARWESQLKDGHLPAIEANRRKVALVYSLYAGCRRALQNDPVQPEPGSPNQPEEIVDDVS